MPEDDTGKKQSKSKTIGSLGIAEKESVTFIPYTCPLRPVGSDQLLQAVLLDPHLSAEHYESL